LIVFGLEQSIYGTLLRKIMVELEKPLKVGSTSKIYSFEGSFASSSFFVRQMILFEASEMKSFKIFLFCSVESKFETFSESASMTNEDKLQI